MFVCDVSGGEASLLTFQKSTWPLASKKIAPYTLPLHTHTLYHKLTHPHSSTPLHRSAPANTNRNDLETLTLAI